jgi:hypothetical protein
MICFINRQDTGLVEAARAAIVAGHYLRRFPDPRTSCETYAVKLADPAYGPLGYVTVGRPEAQRCGTWYGSVADVADGRCEVTRWQILNLSRMWLHPAVQRGGSFHRPDRVPGYVDRHGNFVSTLASQTLAEVAADVRLQYLLARPPCFLEEPYDLRYLLSYCDTSRHRGTIYQAAGFELYRRGGGPSRTIDTYRLPLAALTLVERQQVEAASERCPRAQRYRAALLTKEVIA